METTSLILLSLVITFIYKLVNYLRTPGSPNPFLEDDRKAEKPKVFDQKERDKVIKQNFKPDKLPEKIDAIVIGSGIGGLAPAAILSKIGKKVVVLEQHDQAGGCCHTFIEKGYEFDVGIHYIGDMHHQSPTKTLLDQLCDGQITWEKLADAYDTVVFKEPGTDIVKYPIYSGIAKQIAKLKEMFPGEEDGIDKFYRYVREVSKGHQSSMMVKFMPLWLVKILVKTTIIHKLTNAYKWNERTLKEVAAECTENQYLRDVFCYCFGDYGTVPSKAGFNMQALLLNHFREGGSFPIGGASEIAFQIIPVIERAGGKVLVNAQITEILTYNGEANGVKVKHGTTETSVYAPIIISDAGLYNTYQKLLPQDLAKESRLWEFANKTRPAVAAMNVFVGLNAPMEELDIGVKKNFWIFTKKDIDQSAVDFFALEQDVVEDHDVPLMFLSFPSTKDPTWDQKFAGKTTMSIVTLANYKWFVDWEKNPCMRRGDDYDGLKKTIGHKMIQHCVDMFPKIEKHIDYVSVGTPLSYKHYLDAPNGEIYGLDHTRERFNVMNNAVLRPKTDIPGLFLTGQDVCSCGMTGALYGGLFCAQQVLGRDIITDLGVLHKKIVGTKKKVE